MLRRWWPVAVVVLLLAAAALAAGNSSIGANRIPPVADNIPYVPDYPAGEPAPSIPVEPRTDAERTQADVPQWIATVAIVLLGLAILAALGYLTWTLLRGALRRRTRAVPVARARRTAARFVAPAHSPRGSRHVPGIPGRRPAGQHRA